MQAKEELLALGLKPLSWAEVLDSVREKLDPAGRTAFLRHHKNFVGYLSQDTLDRFYGFVFAHGLHLEVNGFRFHRLQGILDQMLTRIPPGKSILDVGAGAGLVATVLVKRSLPGKYVTQDPCRGARDHLQSMGFAVLPHPAPASPPDGPFDYILCVDSLGEVNADDDGTLARAEGLPAEDLPRRIEERYGFAEKLEPWKAYLAMGGKALLWEPIAERRVWEAMEGILQGSGWKTSLQNPSSRHSYLELTLA